MKDDASTFAAPKRRPGSPLRKTGRKNQPVKFEDQPADYPSCQTNGDEPKSLTQCLLQRRATPHFKPDPIPDEYLEAILRFAAQAPSGFNMQPWKFIVVRDEENRRRLQSAAMNQAKVAEAPVVIIAFGLRDEWKQRIDSIFAESVRRGVVTSEVAEKQKASTTKFLESFPPAVWLNRHTMIAFTVMMIVAEMYGLDTAPMEGFDPEAVKREFGLPEEAEVIALLAIGVGETPDKPYGGRLALSEFVFRERFGEPWGSEPGISA